MAKPYLFLSKKGERNVPSGARPLAIVRGSRDNDGDIIYLVARPEKEEREDQVSFTEQEKMLLRDIVSEKLDKRYNSMRERERAKASLIKSILKNEPLQTPDLKKVKKEIKAIFKEKKDSEIKLDDGLCDLIPNLDTRECLYIAAPSGSGKSYWCRGYAQQFNRLFPKRKVVLISKVSDDSSLKGIKNLVEMPLDLLADDDHIETEDLENTLSIFDDTDTFRDKKVRDEIKDLKHDILECGRHDNIYTLITSHLISNYSHTRTVLNECHGIVFFPSSGSKHQISYVLKNYCGLSKHDISKIYSLNSRWVLVLKHFPVCVVYEKGVYLLGSND